MVRADARPMNSAQDLNPHASSSSDGAEEYAGRGSVRTLWWFSTNVYPDGRSGFSRVPMDFAILEDKSPPLEIAQIWGIFRVRSCCFLELLKAPPFGSGWRYAMVSAMVAILQPPIFPWLLWGGGKMVGPRLRYLCYLWLSKFVFHRLIDDFNQASSLGQPCKFGSISTHLAHFVWQVMPPGSRYLGFGGVAERFAQMLSTRRVFQWWPFWGGRSIQQLGGWWWTNDII